MENEQFVALEKLAQGAVSERFAEEFQKVLANIYDPNTDPCAKRQIVITIDIKANKQRNWADWRASVKSKLAPNEAIHVSLGLGKIGDFIGATEYAAEQPSLLPTSTHPEVV